MDRDMQKERPHEALEIYLGDYVDRGPASANVIDQLIVRQRERKTVFLRGNHERILENFLEGKARLSDWRPIGGLETLFSYGVRPDMLHDPSDDEPIREALAELMPNQHLSFLNKLRPHYSAGAYFFVHAGVRPGIPLEQQAEEDCLWIREDFLSNEDGYGRIIVHGHTPVLQPEFLSNRINLDTGAYATGKLSCLKISGAGAQILGHDQK
jgi:serine/threonine protein phosphatase 1